MTTLEIIGKNITIALKEQHKYIIHVANHLGVTRQTFSTYIDGKNAMNLLTFQKLAKHLNKPMEWFFEEEHVEKTYTDEDVKNLARQNAHFKMIIRDIESKSFDIARVSRSFLAK